MCIRHSPSVTDGVCYVHVLLYLTEGPMSEDTTATPYTALKEALKSGQTPEPTPEIAAIFEQIKHLRESDRSLRSLRRNMELDNVPSLDTVVEDEIEEPAPESDLGQLLESYATLKNEKEDLASKLNDVLSTLSTLQKTVEAQAKIIDDLKPRS